MRNFSQYFIPLTIGMILASLSSYHLVSATNKAPSIVQNNTAPEIDKTPAQTPIEPNTNEVIANPKSTPPTPTMTLNIYQVDSQCQTLVPEKVAVPAETPVNGVISKILEQTSSADFDLAGYRVNLNPKTRIATIDFRLSPDSKRQFVSLSMCEQLALFGSLRKTLTENPPLNIKDVRFTEQDRNIRL